MSVRLIETLKSVVANDENIDTLLRLDKDSLSKREVNRLERLCHHFGNRKKRKTGDDNGRPTGRGGKKPRTESASESEVIEQDDDLATLDQPLVERPSDGPWKRVMNLSSLQLQDNILERVRSCGTDPMLFLNEHTWLTHGIDNFGPATIGDAFLACYTYTKQLEDKEALNRIRWLFQMLMFWDLVKLIRPNGSGRIGRIMEAELKSFLGPLQGALNSEDAAIEMSQWKCCGEKLDILCQNFGPGCLFLLGKNLSKHFLLSKFTASGNYYSSAMNHLRALGIEDVLRQEKFSELGTNIRARLIKPFEDAVIKQRQ